MYLLLSEDRHGSNCFSFHISIICLYEGKWFGPFLLSYYKAKMRYFISGHILIINYTIINKFINFFFCILKNKLLKSHKQNDFNKIMMSSYSLNQEVTKGITFFKNLLFAQNPRFVDTFSKLISFVRKVYIFQSLCKR